MKTNNITRYFTKDHIQVYTLEECDYIELELLGNHANTKDQIDSTNMLISKQSLPLILEFNWYLSKDGYPVGYSIDKINKRSCRCKLHQLLFPYVQKGYVVDHINRNRLDNRLENLRICTQKENSYNTTKSPNTKYQYKGVSQSKKGLWTASITKDGKKHSIKNINSEIEAAQIYDIMAEELFGEFANKNIKN